MKISSSLFQPRELGANNFTEVVCFEESNSRAKKESCVHTHTHTRARTHMHIYIAWKIKFISREKKISNNTIFCC